MHGFLISLVFQYGQVVLPSSGAVAKFLALSFSSILSNTSQSCCGPVGPSDERSTAGDTGSTELLVPRSLAAFAVTTETAYSDIPEPMADFLRTAQCGDACAQGIRDELLSKGMEAEHSPWSLTEDRLLRFKGCVYVPKDAAIRAEVMRTHHDDPQGGHFGEKRTLDTIQRKYYWQGLPGDVKNYVHTCPVCQKKSDNSPQTSRFVGTSGTAETAF